MLAGNSVNFGNQIVLPGSEAQQAITSGRRSPARRVIDINALKQAASIGFDGGVIPQPWTVMLRSEVLGDFSPNPGVNIVPAKALISAASGGVAHQYEVDFFPGSIIVVPANSITVSAFWETLEQNSIGDPYAVPDNLRVFAGVIPGYARGFARSTFYQPAGTPISLIRQPLPPFAKRFAVRATPTSSVYDAGVRYLFGTDSLTYLELNGADMLAITQSAQQMVLLPSNITQVRLQSGGAVTTEPWALEFEIVT